MTEQTPSSDDPRFAQVSVWFETLQERIIAAMEALEREFAGVGAGHNPGRFDIEPWRRADASGQPGGGGRMAMLRGRLFEKMGAHCSLVHGAFPAEFASQIPGRRQGPALLGGWRLGDRPSVEPHVPTGHMNTRLVRTTRTWFGGGADLTPTLDERRKANDPDAIAFHAAMRAACERHPGVADPERFRAWCDEYFYLEHRNEPRGIGGIFFDYLNSAGDAGNSRFRRGFRLRARRRRKLHRGLWRHCPAQRWQAVERSRAAGTIDAAGTVRRVQPPL